MPFLFSTMSSSRRSSQEIWERTSVRTARSEKLTCSEYERSERVRVVRSLEDKTDRLKP